MTELTPFFELLSKVFIVTGLIGAAEIIALLVVFILMASEPRIIDRKKRRSADEG